MGIRPGIWREGLPHRRWRIQVVRLPRCPSFPGVPNGWGGLVLSGCCLVVGGFKYVSKSSLRKLGKMNPIWRAYFFKWVVQPPTSCVCFFLVGKNVQTKRTVGWKKTVCPLKVDCWNRIVSFWILLGPRPFSGASYVSFREGIPKMSWWKIPISPDQWINFSKLSSWAKLTQQNIRAFVGVFLFGSSNSWGVTSWGT